MSQDREQVALRGEGRLLRHIAEELGVCVGTASAWTRGVITRAAVAARSVES